jgi:hypothetical protein
MYKEGVWKGFTSELPPDGPLGPEGAEGTSTGSIIAVSSFGVMVAIEVGLEVFFLIEMNGQDCELSELPSNQSINLAAFDDAIHNKIQWKHGLMWL